MKIVSKSVLISIAALVLGSLLLTGSNIQNISSETETAYVKKSQIGSKNPGFTEGECPTPPDDDKTYGWHFVLPGNTTTFKTIKITFANEGVVTDFVSFPTGKHAYVWTSGPDKLVAGEAQVIGDEEVFNLSHVCAGTPPPTTTTTIPDTTTTTIIVTTTTTIPETTTTTLPVTTTTVPETTTTTIPETTTTTVPETTTTTVPQTTTTTTQDCDRKYIPEDTIPDCPTTTTQALTTTTSPLSGPTTGPPEPPVNTPILPVTGFSSLQMFLIGALVALFGTLMALCAKNRI